MKFTVIREYPNFREFLLFLRQFLPEITVIFTGIHGNFYRDNSKNSQKIEYSLITVNFTVIFLKNSIRVFIELLNN